MSIGDLYELLHATLEANGYEVEGQRDGLVIRDKSGRHFVLHALDLTAALEAPRYEAET